MTRARDLSNLIGSGNYSQTTLTATAGQTSFTVSHTPNFVQVFMNGLLLDPTVDFTANGTAIVLTEAAAVGDELEVVTYETFSVGDAITQTEADTRYVLDTADVITVSGSNVGVGTASPSGAKLQVTGSNYNDQLVIERTDTSSKWGLAGTDSGGFQIYDVNSSNATRMTIDSSGNVGIGTSSIDYAAAGRTVVHVEGSAGALLAMEDTGAKSYFFQSGNDLLLENDTASGSMVFGTNNSTERMRIDASGRVTKPYQPAFNAFSPAKTNPSANVIYGSTRSNIGNHYNTTTGRFTAPIAGTYFFTLSALMGQPYTGSHVRLYFDVNGFRDPIYGDSLMDKGGQVNYSSINMSISLYLNANEYISVWNGGAIPTYGPSYGQFSGHLVG